MPESSKYREESYTDLAEKIRFLYNSKNDLGIKNLIKHQPINLLVGALEELDEENIAIRFLIGAYRIKMGELFLAFSEELKLKVLHGMKAGVISHLLSDLNSDDVYEIFSISPSSIQRKIIFNASKELREEIKQLKEFGFAEAGSIMNTTYITLLKSMNISEAINFLKINGKDFDISEEIFVIDVDDKVYGKVNTKKLFFEYLENIESDREGIISEITEKSYTSVTEEEDIDEVAELFKKYSIKSLAVVDKDEKLIGIIDYQDVIPEILDSNIEDVHKFYGIKETKNSYLSSTVLDIVKSRITCLLIMLFAATITTFAIDKFEELGVMYTAGISTVILVPIIPIITDMCGNTGSQTTATVIQAYSSGEIKETEFKKVIKKEFKVSIVVGAILALFNFLRLSIYFAVIHPDFKARAHIAHNHTTIYKLLSATLNGAEDKLVWPQTYYMGLVGALSSSISLWLVVIFSKFFGVVIPMIAIKYNRDPAAISAPILTTVLDTVSSIIFFGIGIILVSLTITSVFGVTVSGGKLT